MEGNVGGVNLDLKRLNAFSILAFDTDASAAISSADIDALRAHPLTFPPGALKIPVRLALDGFDHGVPIHRVVLTRLRSISHYQKRSF